MLHCGDAAVDKEEICIKEISFKANNKYCNAKKHFCYVPHHLSQLLPKPFYYLVDLGKKNLIFLGLSNKND